MFRKSKTGAIAAAVLVVSQAVAADTDSGFYIGFGTGDARLEQAGHRFDATVVETFAGYAFNEYFAIQAAYVDPREMNGDVGPVRVTVDSKVAILSAIGSVPLRQRWSVFGKLGWAFYDTDQTIVANDVVLAESESDDDLVWGIGSDVRIGERWRLRLEYEAIDISEGDFHSIRLSGAVWF